jgi:hypothetical protein
MHRLRLGFMGVAALVLLNAGVAHGQGIVGGADLKFTEVPLLDCDGTPCVEVRIGDGAPIKMGIDTGDAASVMDNRVAQAAGLKAVGTMPNGAPAGMFRTAVAVLHIGDLTFDNAPFLAMDFTEWLAKHEVPQEAGTLSYTLFKDRMVRLDFPGHKMCISEIVKVPLACSDTCAKFSLITFGKKGPPIVVAEGFEINGTPVTAQVDSMYTGSLLVYGASIEKLGLAEAAAATHTRFFQFTDGGVTEKEAPAAKESFKGVALGSAEPMVYFPTPGVHEPDTLFDATVGLELFRDAVLILDFHDMTIAVKKS